MKDKNREVEKKIEKHLIEMVSPKFGIEQFQKAVEAYQKAKMQGDEETALLRFMDMVDNACYFLRIKGVKELNGKNYHLEIT